MCSDCSLALANLMRFFSYLYSRITHWLGDYTIVIYQILSANSLNWDNSVSSRFEIFGKMTFTSKM